MLDFDKVKTLYDYGKSIKQEVFFTPMFPEAIDWCERIGVSHYKLRCKDKYNETLISLINRTGKPCFVSLDKPFQAQKYEGIYNCYLLYCKQKYPAKFYDYYEDFFEFEHNLDDWDGISSHVPCTCLLEFSYEKGMSYFELHVKLDNTTPLEDAWSVSFNQLESVLKRES